MPRKFAFILLSLLVLGLSTLFSFFYIFTVKHISISADVPCISEEELTSQITKKYQSIFLIQKKQLTAEILQKFSCIDKLDFKTKLPWTLKVFYSGKNPIAKIDSSDLYFTQAGLAIKSTPSGNLPIIFLPPDVQVSENAKITNAEVLSALKIINSLLKSDFIPINVRILSGTVTIYNQEDSVVIFSASQVAESQADSLQKVLAKAKIESKKISKIDMRFNNPIIIFK